MLNTDTTNPNCEVALTYSDIRNYSGSVTQIFVLGRDNNSNAASGVFYLDANDTISTDNDGTTLVDSLGRRWKRKYQKGQIQLDWFNAVGNDSHDSTQSIQSAIHQAEKDGGGVVYLPLGQYVINQGLVANKAVLLRGTLRTDLSTNTNGSGITSTTSMTRLRWNNPSGGVMYTIRASTQGVCIWGGGAIDIEWNGGNTATYGIHLDTTKYAKFRGKVRQVTFCGVQLSSLNGTANNFSMKNSIESLEFTWGSHDNCKNATGLSLLGNTADVAATQQFCGDISGLVYNGALVRIAETDNAQFQSVHGVVQSGGTGSAIEIINAGAQPAHHNIFHYVVGPVKQDNGIIGTWFGVYNSEGGGISQMAGNSNWGGNLVDYVTAKRFQSKHYKLQDTLSLPVSTLVFDNTATDVVLAALWKSKALGSGVQAGFSTIVPPNKGWSNGYITSVDIIVSTNGVNNGNFTLNLKCAVGKNQSDILYPKKDLTYNFQTPLQHSTKTVTFDFSNILLNYTEGDSLFLSVSRLVDDINDTTQNGIVILGVNINYKSTGPSSAGSGTYYVPTI